MSSMLEQAILDAKELKEAAIKNAQQALIEKYSNEFEGEVEKLLEQAAVPPTDPLAAASLAAPAPGMGMPATPASAPVDAEKAKSDSDSKSDIFSKLEYAYKDGEVIGNKVYTNGLVEIDLDSLSEFSFEQNKKDVEQKALQELKVLSRKSKLNEELDEEMNDDEGFDDDSDSFPYDDEDEDMDDEDFEDEESDEDDEDLDMDDEDFEDEDMESDADELDDLHDFNDEEDIEDIDDLDSLDIDDEEVDDFDIEDEEFSDDEDVEDEDLYMSDEDPNRFEIDYETDQDDADYNPDADVEDDEEDEEDSEEDEEESDEEEYYDDEEEDDEEEEEDDEEELEETKKSSKTKHLAKKGVALAAAASTMLGSKEQENIHKAKKPKTEKHVVSEEELEEARSTLTDKEKRKLDTILSRLKKANPEKGSGVKAIIDSTVLELQDLLDGLEDGSEEKEQIKEAIKLDYQRSGPRSPWNGMFREEGEHDVMLAELQSQIAELEQEVEELQESNKKLKNGLKESLKINESLNDRVAKFEEKLLESRFLNYKLLYTNKALTDASLNERQKNKIAESISNARTAEEVKLLYETLKSTMRDGTSSSSPKSLSEAVERRSSSLLLRASRAEAPKQNDYAERMKKLAGLA